MTRLKVRRHEKINEGKFV